MSEASFKIYQRTLDFLRLRKRAYQLAFPDVKNNAVLKDLAKFCHANIPPYHPDPRKTDILIGRQEVFFRIINHLKLQPDDLYEIYNTPSPLTQNIIKEK